MTFPLATEPMLFASMFQNCTFDVLLEAMNAGFQTDDRIVLIPHHEDLPRSEDRAFQSVLGARKLAVGAIEADRFDGANGSTPRSDHKFGGDPYCIQEPDLPGAEDLYAVGTIQALQLEFPTPADKVVEPWPFGGGLFNVFWKPPFFNEPYFWYLQA